MLTNTYTRMSSSANQESLQYAGSWADSRCRNGNNDTSRRAPAVFCFYKNKKSKTAGYNDHTSFRMALKIFLYSNRSLSPSEKPWRESCLSAMAAVGADANCSGGGDPAISFRKICSYEGFFDFLNARDAFHPLTLLFLSIYVMFCLFMPCFSSSLPAPELP